jgi:hypothetical protein
MLFATSRAAGIVVVFAVLGLAARADESVQYNRDVRPILTNACFKCHGPAGRKGGFRLDVRETAVKPARSGAIPIKAGKPGESELVRRIFATDPDEAMPPPSTHVELKPAQKEILKRWIAEGAKYQRHWSFEPPAKVEPPAFGMGNPIDAFIADRLGREGLPAAPDADRPTLARRVAFALTGLPPTPAEVDTFAADTVPGAYERMVDRYLASKHYGEEMARHWLDLARYGDTHGLHLDNERQMWPYRDWVVRAFNDNLPFDRFTIEQLAGDLLPGATRDQLVATGFNRCNVTTSEGGSIESEWVFRNAVDRTSTMAEVWLGLGAGCAVCHDHKFDPLSQKEYYSLYAFFYSASGPALDGNVLLTDPVLKLPTLEQENKLDQLNQKITKFQQGLAERRRALRYHDPAYAPATGEAAKLAVDPSRSFRAWLKRQDTNGLPDDIKNLLKQPKRDAGAEKRLRDYYLENVCTQTRGPFHQLTKQFAGLTLSGLTLQRDALNATIPATFIFREQDRPRDSFVMMRGRYDKPGEKIEPNTPAALPPLVKKGPRATRLELARWLVAPEQPLTARVAVNRLWQQLFGVGLVKSSSDFGAQGELPSHPELLDYLAVRFRESGWDVKAMVRLMVTAAAFRREGKVTSQLLRRDPDNRLLARGPRIRLDAEQVRDNALFVSGLINLEIGGKGVKPYQPPRIWEPVAFTGSNTMNYTQDKGPALYRRSLYTFLKRTAPPPSLANFDAPNRESSCPRRERSNTPLQALQLMNDVQHFEAARGLAQRMLTEGGSAPDERIRFAYRVVLARVPETAEVDIVRRSLQQYLDRFRANADDARKVVQVGESPPRPGLPEPELAAYTLIANLVLNLDETVMRN